MLETIKPHRYYKFQKANDVKKTGICVLFTLMSMFFAAMAYGSIVDKEILSTDERAWLTKNQSRLVLAVETGYAPFVFLDSKDQPTGLAHEYISLIESKLGVQFNQRRFSSLDEIFQKVRSGEVHIVNATTSTPARAMFLSSTDPFISVPNVIIVRKDRPGQISENELSGLKVSLVKSYAITEYMTNRGLPFNPDLVPDDLTALLSVSFGRSDAAVIDLATASYLISEKGITNLRVAGDMAYDIRLSIATPLNESVLHDIIQKGLNAITDVERVEIKNRWINVSKPKSIFEDRQFWIVLGSVLAVAFALLAIVLIWNRSLQRQIVLRKKAEKNIEAAALYSRSLIESSLDPLVTISAEGKITDVNNATVQVTGVARENLLGSDFADYFTEPKKARAGYQQVFLEQSITDYPLAIRHVSGKVTDVLYNANVFHDADGNVIGVFAAARDVTERNAAEAKLRMLSTAIEQGPTSIVIANLDAEIEYVNPRFTVITGYSFAEVAGENPRLLQSGLTDKSVYDDMWGKLTNGLPWSGELTNKRKNGEIFFEEAYISPVKVADGPVTHYVAVKLDITERKKMEELVRQLAFYDPLTQLPNRRLLNDRLSQVFAAGKRSNCYGALMFLDLDNFKPLNDAHGHVVGDLLLIEVAGRLESCIREMDTVARFGGDEFVVMLADLDENKAISLSQAEIVAEKIRAVLSVPYMLKVDNDNKPESTIEHHCTVSIGVVAFTHNDAASQEDVMKWADDAMYQAKDAGRNQIRFF